MNKLFLLVLAFIFLGCQETAEKKKIRIVISKEKPDQHIQNYSGWLERYHSEIEWFNAYPLGIDSTLKLLETSHGVLISGGEDVFPGLYGKIKDTARCGKIDRYRDSLELAMIDFALKNDLPLLGICRGLQIINVAFGGSLIVDIPTDRPSNIFHRQKDWENCYHEIYPVLATHFNVLTDGITGDVASNHHQAIDILGERLQISAYSPDSLPEAFEWSNRGEKAFLMAVQWHPERMDTLHHLSKPLATAFITEAEYLRDGY